MSTLHDRHGDSAHSVTLLRAGSSPAYAKCGLQVEARILAGPHRDFGGFLRALQRLEAAIAFLSQHRSAASPLSTRDCLCHCSLPTNADLAASPAQARP